MLMALGLFPAVAGFIQHIPEPVLVGAIIVMFGTIAASGVRIVSRERLNRCAIMIIALSLARWHGRIPATADLAIRAGLAENFAVFLHCRRRYYRHRAKPGVSAREQKPRF